jgi:hypothetical protein
MVSGIAMLKASSMQLLRPATYVMLIQVLWVALLDILFGEFGRPRKLPRGM